MVQIKKIIFFLFIFCFLFTNAQENNLKEQYKNLENNEQKLDFIFNQIVLKQIKDFQKLEQKIKTLETERDLLKQNQKQQVLKSLKDDTLSKSLEIQKLQSKAHTVTHHHSPFVVGSTRHLATYLFLDSDCAGDDAAIVHRT